MILTQRLVFKTQSTFADFPFLALLEEIKKESHSALSSLNIKKTTRKVSEKPLTQKTRVYPYPLGAGSARPNPKMGAPDPENPLFLGFLCSEGD